MKIRLHIVLAVALTILTGCREDPEQAANKLFVETSPLWAQYQTLPKDDPTQFDARLKILNQVEANLSKILSDYPQSSLAVELASTGKVKNINKAEVDSNLEMLNQKIDCMQKPISCALKVAQGIADNGTRSKVLAEIAREQAISGDSAGARDTIASAVEAAEGIADNGTRSFSVEEIARVQAAMGDVAEARASIAIAIEAAEGIPDNNVRSRYIALIAGAQAATGDTDWAQKTVDGISKNSARHMAIAEMAIGLAISGDVAGALKMAEDLRMREDKLKDSLQARGVESAESAEDIGFQARALSGIAREQAITGDVVGAMKTAEGIQNEHIRAETLERIEKFAPVSK